MKNPKTDKLKMKPLAHAVSCVLALSAFNISAQENDDSNEDEAKSEKVIIVGSRIRRDGFNSEEPIEIISASEAASQGIESVGELLRRSTIAAGSPQVTAASSTAFVQNGGTGAETLSLRGLGANRTLVLLNGRRAGPAGTRGGVSAFDFNVLPISAIDRIEILKDGASSVYGSDAVAGVVNIITKTGDGGTIDLFASIPEETGGENTRLSGTFGKSFERGSFRVTADFNRQAELAQGDRDYYACGQRYIFDPNTGQRADPIDPRTGSAHCSDLLWGHVWIYDYQGAGGNVPTGAIAQYDYDGDLANYIPGFAVDPNNPGFMVTPPGWFPVSYDRASDSVANADHPFQDLQSLVPESERATIFAQGEYDITDDIQGYAEVLLNRRTTDTNSYRQFWGFILNENFFGGNPLSAGWTGSQWLSPTPITDHSFSNISVDYSRVVAGLTGDVGDWYWDLSYQISRSEGEYTTAIIYNDAIVDQNFASGSCVGTTTSVRGVDCIDIPWLDPQFLAGNISPEMRNYLFGTDTGVTIYDQQTLEGSISIDELFEVPAGPVGFAGGFHYRVDEIGDTPGEETRRGNIWGASSAGITVGEDTTKALFFEAQIPIVYDLPGINALELKVSARHTDVKTAGTADTFKIGAIWEVVDGFNVRMSRGTSFRSPALFELYLADQTSFLSQRLVDPCIRWGTALANGDISQRTADNCAADGIADDYTGGAISATVVSRGGLGRLSPETSVAETIGFVWQPEFADLQVSLDYFNFEIEEEVTQLGALIPPACYASEFFATGDPVCGFFDRDPVDQRIVEIRDDFINISRQRNRGYDLAITYRTDLDIGSLTLSSKHTYQKESSRALFEDNNIDTNGRFGDPKHVATLRAQLDRDNWSYFWTGNFFGKVSNVEAENGDTATYRGQTVRLVIEDDATLYHTFSARYDVPDSGLSAVFGVANALDERPPQVSTIQSPTVSTIGDSAFYSQYDPLGRRVFFNLTYDF
ncbi:TonB-dependent receptor domain-containing protein [Pleionea sp. CnH1-48]|uniref:TonB-dependent receptor domain-containing protein n=1 Tax=Pleionea sp. CnH1-48 TaxID=2954494 RepID=UPI0020986224|nr:TonB-dependent receptor [Pleionea sp. CnH1-48]MCO7227237.1 TonB-dependent receptor [Pleionea sp. CnH1-48]